MGDKTVLLTYIKDGKCRFDWFDSVHDMEISIIEQRIKEDEICDMLKIDYCEQIKLSTECKACMSK